MPAFLDSGDRRFVIGAFVAMLALLGLAYLLRPAEQETIGTPSSYSAQWAGTKAAFLLLEQSGYNVERWVSPPSELPEPSAGTTLILAEPPEGGSAEDRAAISRFVFSGGRLLVTGWAGARFAPEARSAAVPTNDLSQVPYSVQLPSPLSRNAPEITMVAPDKWTSLSPSQLAIYSKDGMPGVVWYRFGKGEVIWWAISSPMSNGSIRDKDNLALFLNSVGPPSTNVLWDEYFYGMRRSLSSYFATTPLPWAGAQLWIVCLALLFTFSRRSGPVWMPLAESRTSPLEFVSTVGELYQSAHAASGAVETAYQRLHLSLLRKLGMSGKTKLPELCRAASARLGWPEDALFNTLSQAERSMRDIGLDDETALDLVRTLHDYRVRLEARQR